MSNQNIIEAVNRAMANQHIDDRVAAAGQFSPRGSSGGMFVGPLAGDNLLGEVAGAWRCGGRRWCARRRPDCGPDATTAAVDAGRSFG